MKPRSHHGVDSYSTPTFIRFYIVSTSRENSAQAFPISSGVSAICCGGVIRKNQVCCRDEDAKREVSEED